MLEEQTLEAAYGRIACLRNASAPADAPRVLALHGWLDNAASFIPLAAHLPPLDLVAIDLPGHGRSMHLPAGGIYTMEAAVHAVLDAADALGWQRFALLGHSMGAGIASVLAAAVPERIERAVFIEALGALPERPERTASRLRESVAATRAVNGERLRVFADMQPAIAARMRANALSEATAALLVERGVRSVSGGYVWSSDPRLLAPTFLRPTDAQVEDIVRGITCPALVLFAEPAQPYLPDPVRRRYAACLPDGRLHVLPGSHHLHMEAPAEIAALMAHFLVQPPA